MGFVLGSALLCMETMHVAKVLRQAYHQGYFCRLYAGILCRPLMQGIYASYFLQANYARANAIDNAIHPHLDISSERATQELICSTLAKSGLKVDESFATGGLNQSGAESKNCSSISSTNVVLLKSA